MLTTVLVILSLLLLVVVMGEFTSKWESRRIVDQNADGGAELDHTALTWQRIAMLCIPLIIGVTIMGWAALLALMCMASFSLFHRYRLNKRRGYPWHYLAPGNWWNRIFLRCAWVLNWGTWPSRKNMRATHKLYHGERGEAYRNVNADAGMTCTIMEWLTLAGSIAIMLINAN